MENCEIKCHSSSKQLVKVHFFDRIVGRSLDEKLRNFCHINCLKKNKIRNEKRSGRWGFIPILGMTEAFSSLLALISFFISIWKYQTMIKHKIHQTPMKRLYLIQFYTCCSAFLSSFMFHFRETTFTRNADYFSAFGCILMSLLVAINRLVLLEKPEIHSNFAGVSLKIAISYFIFHVYKMTCFEFDYFYNKIACGLMFFMSCICDFITFLNFRKHSHSKNIIYSISCLLLAGGIEILDISPIFYLFDSHAVWHLLMAISTPYYYNFIAGEIDLHCPLVKLNKLE